MCPNINFSVQVYTVFGMSSSKNYNQLADRLAIFCYLLSISAQLSTCLVIYEPSLLWQAYLGGIREVIGAAVTSSRLYVISLARHITKPLDFEGEKGLKSELYHHFFKFVF